MNEQFPPGYVCWSADGLEMIKSNVGDFGADDNPVLAALHEKMLVSARVPGSPPKHFGQVFGSAYSDADDAEILKGFNSTISDPTEFDSNLLIAVKGETGSGKSHLVRWMYQNAIRPDNARFVWVIRREDSKMQVIRKFVDDLAEIGSKKADELKLLIDSSFRDASDEKEKIVRNLYWELAEQLNNNDQLIQGKSNPQIRALLIGKDNDNQNYLHNLLLRYIDDELSGRIDSGFISVFRGVVENLDNETIDLRANRRSESTGFTEAVTKKILRRYERFADQKYFDLLTTSQSNCSTVTELLNEALDVAIAKVLHVDGAGFKEIFTELRKEMASLGQQLVIFMEDFSGVASSQQGLNKLQADLLEVFTESASPDRAPLRVVYAITDNTFQVLPTNVVERHGLVVDINRALSATNATSFISRYLNISRSTPKQIKDAFAKSTMEHRLNSNWIPNKCDSCTHRNQCHDIFGASSDGVGLYPMNRFVTERVFAKHPDEPRHIVSRTKNFLLNSQSSINDFTFPTTVNLDSNLLSDDLDRAKMLERRFVRSAEDAAESARKVRYTHIWGNGAPPSGEEERIFKFKDLGDLLREDLPAKSDLPSILPRPELEEVKRIELWCAAESDEGAANSLTNNLYTRLRNSVSRTIVENFDLSFGKIQIYRDLGLRFGDQSITIAGFSEPTERSLLLPFYSIPRNDYGKSVLIGSYLQEQLRDGQEVSLGAREIQATSCFSDFVLHAVNDLAGRAKTIEHSMDGPFGITARCIKFLKMTGGPDHEKPIADVIGRWFASSDTAVLEQRRIKSKIDELFEPLAELRRVVKETIDANGTYSMTSMVEGLVGAPTEILNGVLSRRKDMFELTEARQPKWFKEVERELDVGIEKFLSKAHQEDLSQETAANFAYCSRHIPHNAEVSEQNLKELANKIINNTNRTILREDFFRIIEDSIKLFEFWAGNQSCLEDVAQNEFNFDKYLIVYSVVEEFNRHCVSFRQLQIELLKADQIVRDSIKSRVGIAAIEPVNLEILSSIDGVDTYVSE